MQSDRFAREIATILERDSTRSRRLMRNSLGGSPPATSSGKGGAVKFPRQRRVRDGQPMGKSRSGRPGHGVVRSHVRGHAQRRSAEFTSKPNNRFHPSATLRTGRSGVPPLLVGNVQDATR
jgi:hypothetical protein